MAGLFRMPCWVSGQDTRTRCRIAHSVTLLMLVVLARNVLASEHYYIGTGSIGATFYPMAESLCQHINRHALGFTCEALSTAGSRRNLEALERGDLDLALSQATLQYLAYKGSAPFRAAHTRVRTVAPLHREVFILAVTRSSGISGIRQLAGKRVNIGNPASGSRMIVEGMLAFLGMGSDHFTAYGAKSGDLPEMFCDDRIDAAIYSTGHPNAIYAKMIDHCDVKLVDLWGDDIAHFVGTHPEFVAATIPAKTYTGVEHELQGFGVQVLLSARSDLPREHIALLLEFLDKARAQLAGDNRIFDSVDATAPIGQSVAPYHQGAEDYLQASSFNSP